METQVCFGGRVAFSSLRPAASSGLGAGGWGEGWAEPRVLLIEGGQASAAGHGSGPGIRLFGPWTCGGTSGNSLPLCASVSPSHVR